MNALLLTVDSRNIGTTRRLELAERSARRPRRSASRSSGLRSLTTLSKQRSILLPQTATMSKDSVAKFGPFDKVECCFDIVAVFNFWQQCCRFRFVQFVSTLSKGRNFVRHCCRNRQHCCQKRKQCRSNRQVGFANILVIIRISSISDLRKSCNKSK